VTGLPLSSVSVAWGLAALAAGYALGSIPFGLLLTRAAGMGDIRRMGSGNIGATNVLRTGRKGLALLTLLLDGGKGALAAALAAPLGPAFAAIAGFGAVTGHVFPLWLKGRGGKGVATALGALLVLALPVGLGAALVWLATAALFRYSSLAALTAAAAAPVLGWTIATPSVVAFAAAAAVLVWWRHRANITRLIAGTEPRIGEKSPPDGPTATGS
jgi:glycerol-3-phosphate acyltransferase PlsY